MSWRLTASALLLLFGLPAAQVGASPRRSMTDLPATPAPLVGRNGTSLVQPRETLMDLAFRERVGFLNLQAANPGLDPWFPPQGAEVILPTGTVLPFGVGPGITINLAEYRLYYVWEEKKRRRLLTYPIGIGVEGSDTPLGTFSVVERIKKPTWHAPASIRRERPEEPAVIPPGPDNPLGDYWIGLSAKGYGIHGTNKPLGVGRRVSHGCIRLYPEDIRDLFRRVRPGTPVRIIYQPLKVGLDGGRLVLEAHHDFLGAQDNPLHEVIRQKRALQWRGPIDLSNLLGILRERKGVPLPLLPHP